MSDAAPPDRPAGNLTRQTVTGIQWSYLGSIVGGVLQFGMTAVMARLLTPAAFGLVALAGLFLRFVDYFARAGISQALIQKPKLAATDIRAAFTLSAGLGALFCAAAVAAAPLAGRIARDPALVPVIRWMALILLLNGLGATAIALLRRSLRFKEIAIIEVGSYIVGYIGVGLAMALTGAGVYALVAAMIVQMGVMTTTSYLLVQHPVLPTRAGGSYRAILGFGGRVSIISFFEFLQTNLDTLIVGRWAGSSQLGLYNRAKVIGELPTVHLTLGMSKVLFPSFSAIQLDQARLRTVYVSAIGIAAAVVLPLNAGMAVAAPEIIRVVLGPQWEGAIAVMPWLLLASTLTLLGMFAGIVAEARAALNAKLLVAVCATLALGGLLFLARGGPLAGYGAAVAAAAAISHLGYVWILTNTLEATFRELLRPYLRTALGALIVAAAIAGVRSVAVGSGAPTVLVLSMEVLTGALTLAVLLLFGPMRPFRDDLGQRLMAAGIGGGGQGRFARSIAWALGGGRDRVTRSVES
jgi:lipopolysaccharide exporter